MTPRTQPFDQAMKDIQAFHLDVKGWTDIFYAFAIYHDGRIAEGRGWNKAQGTENMTPDGYLMPVVFIGNYEHDEPTAAQLASWNWLHGELLDREASALHRRHHRMRAATACPGANIIEDWAEFSDLSQLPQEGLPDMTPEQFKILAGGINDIRKRLEAVEAALTEHDDDLDLFIEKPFHKGTTGTDGGWRGLNRKVDEMWRTVTGGS